MRVAAEIIELPEPVLRLGIAESEKEIPGIVGFDVGNAPFVADDLGAVANTGFAVAGPVCAFSAR